MSPLVLCWDRMLHSMAAFWQDRIDHTLDIHRRLMRGEYDVSSMAGDVVRFWGSWASLMGLPGQGWGQYQADVPTLSFTLDATATLAPEPQEVQLPLDVDPQRVRATELQRVGGKGRLRVELARLVAPRHGIRLTLHPGAAPGELPEQGLEPGLYTGVVYTREAQGLHALALLQAFVRPSAAPAATGG
jgi:hypothetical protein